MVSLRKLMILSEDVSLKSSFTVLRYSIFSDMTKFSASNEKMLNGGEMFIT